MAVPRNRHSHKRSCSKRSHMAKKPKTLTKCQNCSKSILPHRICPHCGYYGERLIIDHAKTS